MNRIGHQEIVNVSAICRNGDVNGFLRTIREVGDTHDVVEILGIVNVLWLMILQIGTQDEVLVNTVDSKSIITLPWVTIGTERFVGIVCHLLHIAKEEPSLVVLLQIMRRKHKMFGVIAVGGMIEDFSSDPNHVTGRRIVPLESEDIHRYMRSRNGMNHVTVMFKKEELLRVGNYRPFHLNEDYYLWVRMIQQGCQLMNIPDVLVRVRAEKEQVDRRGGFPYFRDQYRVFKYMLNTGFISWPRFLLNICERGTVQLLMPLSVRCWFYQRFLRK